jgi:hypothetical protein
LSVEFKGPAFPCRGDSWTLCPPVDHIDNPAIVKQKQTEKTETGQDIPRARHTLNPHHRREYLS